MDIGRFEARRIGLGVRPPRVALLIPHDLGFEQVEFLIATATSAWGGMAWCLIPTDGESIEAPFSELLRRYDPDYVARYPALEASAEVWERVWRETCVFQGVGAHPLPVSPGNLGYPLTGVEVCATEVEMGVPGYAEGLAVYDPEVDADPLTAALIYSWTGRLVDETRNKLEERGIALIPALRDDASSSSLSQILDRSWFESADGHIDPLGLSLRFLGGYSPVNGQMYPPVVVVGETLQDFCLFWDLRAFRGNPWYPLVSWVPEVGTEMTAQSNLFSLSASLNWFYRRRSAKRILVTSASKTLDSAEVTKFLAGARISNEIDSAQVETENSIEVLAPWRATYWEENNVPGVNASIAQFMDGRGVVLLNTPTPRNIAKAALVTDVNWVVDAEIEGLLPPRRPNIASLLIDIGGFAEGRASTHGVSYEGTSGLVLAGANVESILIRPRPLLPSDNDIISARLADSGLLVETSDKGDYEREALRLMGGLETIGHHLRNPGAARLLMRLADDSKNKEGVFDEGVHLSRREGRILRLSDLAKLVQSPSLPDLLDRYLERRVIHRGVFVKCVWCRGADWYSVADIAEEVLCSRCRRAQMYPANTEVYFRLDQMLYQMITHNSHIGLLALDHLRKKAQWSFLHSTASLFSEIADKEAPRKEADILAVIDGDLVLGEAKTSNKFKSEEKSQLKGYVKLCERVGATTFVVATNQDSWSDSANDFLDSLSSSLERVGVKLTRLSATDLGWNPSGDSFDLDALLTV